MSVNVNTVIIAGNLTRDPEVKVLGGDRSVANFSLAINRRFKGSDGKVKEEVVYADCEAWGRTAELIGQYLTKGRGCLVEGRLALDQWRNKEGQPRSRLKVVAEGVQFLGAPAASTGGHS